MTTSKYVKLVPERSASDIHSIWASSGYVQKLLLNFFKKIIMIFIYYLLKIIYCALSVSIRGGIWFVEYNSKKINLVVQKKNPQTWKVDRILCKVAVACCGSGQVFISNSVELQLENIIALKHCICSFPLQNSYCFMLWFPLNSTICSSMQRLLGYRKKIFIFNL